MQRISAGAGILAEGFTSNGSQGWMLNIKAMGEETWQAGNVLFFGRVKSFEAGSIPTALPKWCFITFRYARTVADTERSESGYSIQVHRQKCPANSYDIKI